MDLTRMIAPKSDQKNSDDFLTGPQTFTITAEVEYDNEQQPAGLVLDGDTAHPYKPGKSMGRVLTAAWEKGSWVGRRLTLYTDTSVRFGGQEVGGIRISHMSNLPGNKVMKLALTEKKGSKKPFVVAPLVDVKPSAKLANNSEPIPLSDRTRSQMFALLTEAGVTTADHQRAGMSHILGRPIASRAHLTEDDARAVILDLQGRA